MLPVLFELLLIAILVAVVLVVRRRRAQTAALPRIEAGTPERALGGGPQALVPRRPVVLVHGLLGFDQFGFGSARMEYFRGVSAELARRGARTYAVRLPPVAAVPARAQALVDAIAALPHERFDLIAHSLGGLDARWALTHLGLASRVATLVTIGTPHRGSPLADLAVGGPLDGARRIVGSLGLSLDALHWLTTEALIRFNRDVPDVPGVRYACVVGAATRPRTPLPLLSVSHAYLRKVAGPNDGLVPASSQYWGEVLAEVEADHFAQIGWRVTLRPRFDALGMYARLIEHLAAPVVSAACEPPPPPGSRHLGHQQR